MKLLFKNLLLTLLMPGSVAVWIPWYLAGPSPSGSTMSRIAAGALFVLGGAIYAWCLWDFATFGRGTPAPIDAPKYLVVRGLYRYSRNPMYIGILAVVSGWIVRYGSVRLAFYGAVVATVFHGFTRLYEEPHLARVFGHEYASYRERVGRWLPRPPHDPHDKGSGGEDLIEAHKGCTNHREVISAAERCGCFYCCTDFKPSSINEWVDPASDDMQAGTTALCPRCGIDAVIALKAGMDADFLRRMKAYWF